MVDRACKNVLEIKKDFKEAWYYFAVNSYVQKNYTDSVEASLRAIEIDGNYAKARLCLGVSLYRQNRFIEAVGTIRDLLNIDKENQDAKNILKVMKQKNLKLTQQKTA